MVVKDRQSRFLLALTVVLATLLVASNLWWLYVSIDKAVTQSYSLVERRTADFALRQALTLLPVAFAARDEEGFLAATEQRLRTARPEAGGYALGEDGRVDLGRVFAEPYEKNGCIWIGTLGFRFDQEGSLQHVSRGWNSGEVDPCFPSSVQ